MPLPGREELEACRRFLLRALLEPDPELESRLPEAPGLPVPADAAGRADAAERDIVAHARMAATLGVLPVVDLIAVTALQARLLRRLADLHGVRWDAALAREFIARLGLGVAGGIVGHTVGRNVLKILPLVGQSAGAAWSARSSLVATYAVGKAADHFLERIAAGDEPAARTLRLIHARAAAEATRIARSSGRGGPGGGGNV